MKRWGIQSRVLFLALVPTATIAIILSASFIIGGIKALDTALQERGISIARHLAPASEYGLFSGNRDALQALVQATMGEPDVLAVQIRDRQGRVQAAGGHPAQAVPVVAGQGDAVRVSEGKGHRLVFAMAVYQGDLEGFDIDGIGTKGKRATLGQVSVELSTLATVERQRQLVVNSLLITLAGLALSALLAVRLSRDVIRPIRRLAAGVRKLADGRLDTRLPANSPAEIGALEEGVNIMAANLKAAQENLQERIDEATSELAELNASLERRVKDEVEKNLGHERLLIHQSRLAAMGEMIGNITHQWRQPLHSLSLLHANIKYAFKAGRLSQESMEEFAQFGQKLIMKMASTIDDFSNFFKPNKEKVLFQVREPIGQALMIVGANFKAQDIDVGFEPGEAVQALGFPNELSQVVLNILSNAKEVLAERGVKKGRIAIRLERAGEFSFIHISDNGGGIAEAVLPQLFDPYFTTKEKGSGIGLYMSKMIMERMGGRIEARNVEGGAEFSLALPAG
ncbi:MAG: sensor histidine kinase [Burkholderiales bacterium]